MTSQYVVCCYYNMISGEFINIGLYTYDFDEDKTKVYSKFVLNWPRLNALFGIEGDKPSDGILKSLVEDWLSKIDQKDVLQEMLKNSGGPWSSLQFTEPRASLLPAEQLLEDIAKDFLIE